MLLTTSRRTSQRTRTFCRELASILPYCEYVNRGKKSIREVLDQGFKNAHERVLVIETKDGNPYKMASIPTSKGLEWEEEFTISVRTRKDLGLNPRVPALREDLPVGYVGSRDDKLFKRIAGMFEADESSESDVMVTMERMNGSVIVNFLRSDVSKDPVGPLIKVKI